MRIKKIAAAVCFLIVLALIVGIVQYRLIPYNEQDTNQTSTFYKLEKNSVDILAVGSSSVMVGFSPLVIYDNTEITSYVRCSSVQSPLISYYNVKESLKTQKPELVVISAYTLLLDYDYDEYEAWVRRGMDYKKLSLDKIMASKAIADRSQWQTTASFILPILRYHSRWNSDLSENALKGQYDYMHGQYPVYRTNTIKDVSEEKMTDKERVHSSEDNLYWYSKIAELCKDNNIEMLFLVTPDMRWTMGKHEEIARVAEKFGAEFLDFNVNGITAKCGLDWESDFYDNHHVNAGGSVKLSNYLSGYLKEIFDLQPSEVTNADKIQFEKDIKRFKRDLETK